MKWIQIRGPTARNLAESLEIEEDACWKSYLAKSFLIWMITCWPKPPKTKTSWWDLALLLGKTIDDDDDGDGEDDEDDTEGQNTVNEAGDPLLPVDWDT